MKGVVFNLLEEAVTAAAGPDAWDDILSGAKVTGAYTSLGNYGDAEVRAILAAAERRLKKPEDDLLRWFGREALPKLAAVYPFFFTPHRGTKAFVETLNEVIHPEVRKLYPGADVPSFDFSSPAANRLVLGYRSHRKWCAFAEGLLEGAAVHYGERVTITQPRCMRRGDEHCSIDCTFSPA
jgi:hypothetical protein